MRAYLDNRRFSIWNVMKKEKQQKYIHSERLQGVNVFELLESSASNNSNT